jgi:Mor family transcriptional regulator
MSAGEYIETKTAEATSRFSKLADLIGDEAALRVREEFGGLVVSIPKLDDVRRRQRDDAIRSEYDKSGKVSELARKHGLGIRQIYNILKKQP